MNMKDINNTQLEILGIGSEGTVYKANDNAIKVFHKSKSFKDKYKKIILIKSLNFDFIPEPKNFVSIDKIPVGYEMDLVKNSKDMRTAFNYKTKEEKIIMLQELEKNIKKLHEKHIVMVDCNLHNFLVNDKKIMHIDVDNYKVGNLDPNILPDYYYPYYSEKITTNIDKNFDKFQMTLNAIEHLIDEDFYKELLKRYNSNADYLEYYIQNVNINEELRELLLLQISDSLNKEYIGNHLHLFKK